VRSDEAKIMKKLLLFLMLIFTLQGFAQELTGSIKGTVQDKNGAVIPGAVISIEQITEIKEVSYKKTSTSNSDGEFYFSSLPFGLYNIEVKTIWTSNIFKKQVKVTAEKPSIIDVVVSIEGCTDVEETKDLTTDEDKSFIIKDLLNDKGVQDLLKIEKTENKSKPIFSTENIKTSWLGEFATKFILMSKSEIQKKADETGDFKLYGFSPLKVKGTCVEATFNYYWITGKNSGNGYLDGNTITYEFRKVDGKWIKKFIMATVS
jgi:hypothetical protein